MTDGKPAAEGSTAELGGDAGGFRISSSPGVLRVTAWGYWPPDVVAALARDAITIGQKLMPTGIFVMDAAQLKPQGVEGQESLRLVFRSLAAKSFAKGTVIAHNVLTKMQLARLVRECGLEARIGFGDGLP
jgi:hypothetical protein